MTFLRYDGDRPENTSRKIAGLPGQRDSFKDPARQSGIQRFNGLKSNRHFGINNWIDQQSRLFGTLGQCLTGSRRPFGVAGGDVQQNIAIHQDAAATAKPVGEVVQKRFHGAYLLPLVSSIISSVDKRELAHRPGQSG
jgi:hypothetical protein